MYKHQWKRWKETFKAQRAAWFAKMGTDRQRQTDSSRPYLLSTARYLPKAREKKTIFYEYEVPTMHPCACWCLEVTPRAGSQKAATTCSHLWLCLVENSLIKAACTRFYIISFSTANTCPDFSTDSEAKSAAIKKSWLSINLCMLTPFSNYITACIIWLSVIYNLSHFYTDRANASSLGVANRNQGRLIGFVTSAWY